LVDNKPKEEDKKRKKGKKKGKEKTKRKKGENFPNLEISGKKNKK
jgi:hypothetical protein